MLGGAPFAVVLSLAFEQARLNFLGDLSVDLEEGKKKQVRILDIQSYPSNKASESSAVGTLIVALKLHGLPINIFLVISTAGRNDLYLST